MVNIKKWTTNKIHRFVDKSQISLLFLTGFPHKTPGAEKNFAPLRAPQQHQAPAPGVATVPVLPHLRSRLTDESSRGEEISNWTWGFDGILMGFLWDCMGFLWDFLWDFVGFYYTEFGEIWISWGFHVDFILIDMDIVVGFVFLHIVETSTSSIVA